MLILDENVDCHCNLRIYQGLSISMVQDMMEGVGGTDASGNPILGDVGKFFYDKVGAREVL